MKNIEKFIILLFLICFILFALHINLSKPRIFILHSYAKDFSWVNDINIGIDRVLNKKPYAVKWFYMDTKKHPDENYKKRIGKDAIKVINQWNPDILIAFDDNAQEYVAKYYIDHPKIKVIFAGMNAEPSQYNYDKAQNVTGILERIPLVALKEMMESILPEGNRKIIHLSDASETSKFVCNEFQKYDWSPFELVEDRMCKTFDDWKGTVAESKNKADIIFITHYHTIAKSRTDSSIMQPQKIIEWTDNNSKIPAISTFNFFVADGGMLAVGVSAYEQGEETVKMAIDIIENKKKGKDIPIKKNEFYVLFMRKSGLEKHNMKIPPIYEQFARALNNYFE